MMTEGDPSALLEGFIRHVRALAEDNSYQHLKGVLDENSTLKERDYILNITNDENHRTISKLQQQLDDSTKRGRDQDEEITALTEKKVLLEARVSLLESDAETTKAQLNENADKISRLQADVSFRDSEIEGLTTSLEEEKSALAAERAAHEETSNELQSTRNELETKQVALEETTSELQSATNELESKQVALEETTSELQLTREELEGLKVNLDEEKSALAKLQVAHEEATKELKSTREDLEGKNTRLGELNALSYKMKSPPQDQTNQQLQSIFTMVYSWAENLFIDDLESSVFVTPASGTIWAKIRNHGRVNRVIPLPLSNTREAKQMRICAVLAILAWSLAQYIFQPTYLLQCNELADLLAGLADDDPVREHYLRSVLLPVLPSKQKANGKKRIEQVVVEVFASISPVLPNSKHDEFRSSLETLCKQVCGQWMRLQLLDEKIEPSFDAYDEEDWKLLGLPTFAGKDVDGAGEASAESAIADDDQYQGVGDIEEISAVLWPSFLSFRGGESELLSEGFVLNKAQARPAYNEEKAALLQGIHRAARQISRKDRSKSFVTNGEDMSVAKSFLPLESEEQSVTASNDVPNDEPNEESTERVIPEPNASETGPADGEEE